MENAIHKFEAAGLGKAPFKVVGFSQERYQACPGAPIQVGGSCDYCGQGIVNTFRIKSADGKVFKVGPDCVAKTGDAGLRKVVDRKIADARRDATHARQDRAAAEGEEILSRDDVRTHLAGQPSPWEWAAKEGQTLLDAYERRWNMSGRTGRVKITKELRAIAAALG